MAEARRGRNRCLAGAAPRGAGGGRCPGDRWPGRPGLAGTGERGPEPSGHRAAGRHELGGERRSRGRDQCTHPGGRRRPSRCDPHGRWWPGEPAPIRRRAPNHGSARRRPKSRGAHAAQLFDAHGRRRWRQHARPTAARAHAARTARPDGRPGARYRQVAAGARRAHYWRSSRQGPGLPTQAVAVSTAYRYSFHTSTETSSTGRGIGGSGLAALMRTLSAP
jgi:hypothetical protein